MEAAGMLEPVVGALQEVFALQDGPPLAGRQAQGLKVLVVVLKGARFSQRP
jgi:hypothetical protein